MALAQKPLLQKFYGVYIVFSSSIELVITKKINIPKSTTFQKTHDGIQFIINKLHNKNVGKCINEH